MLGVRSDLPFDGDATGRFLPAIIAFMVFLAALALASAIVLDGATARWSESLRGALTVQIVPGKPAETEAAIDTVLDILLTTEGVASAETLPVAEIVALLEPWLGTGNVSSDLPLPRLIDVVLRPGAPPDVAALAARIEAAVPGARLDDHQVWVSGLVRLGRSVQAMAAAVVALIGLAAVAVVVFTTRAGLAVHRDIIEIMHIIGARDSYIARQFQRHALLLGLRGGAIGLALAAATLIGGAALAGEVAAPLLPRLVFPWPGWAGLAALPFATAAIATVTARVTVMRALARLA